MRFLEVVERRIRQLQESGAFRGLRGEGRPQKIEENPYEDPEMRLAHKILKNAGMCPPWMDLMREIDDDLAAADRVWETYRRHRRDQMSNVTRATVLHFSERVGELDSARNRTLAALEDRWAEINRKVDYLNALVPGDSFRRNPINVERRRREFETEFPLLEGVLGRRA